MSYRGEPEERAHCADGEEHMPRQVALRRRTAMRMAARQLQQAPRRECGERQVGEEQPPPARVRHDDTADDRAADARGSEDGGEVALETRPLARRYQLTDQRL